MKKEAVPHNEFEQSPRSLGIMDTFSRCWQIPRTLFNSEKRDPISGEYPEKSTLFKRFPNPGNSGWHNPPVLGP